ncbi:MAG: dehalogenase [Deltaproteobacteria bacterium]|nr:dehalogenase [Deltaproteobacteria bacterium]
MWWFIYGVILGAAGMRMVMWARTESVNVAWFAWPIAVIGLIFGTLAVQNFFASYAEMEPKAAKMGLLFMGIPAIILGCIALWLFIGV